MGKNQTLKERLQEKHCVLLLQSDKKVVILLLETVLVFPLWLSDSGL